MYFFFTIYKIIFSDVTERNKIGGPKEILEKQWVPHGPNSVQNVYNLKYSLTYDFPFIFGFLFERDTIMNRSRDNWYTQASLVDNYIV